MIVTLVTFYCLTTIPTFKKICNVFASDLKIKEFIFDWIINKSYFNGMFLKGKRISASHIHCLSVRIIKKGYIKKKVLLLMKKFKPVCNVLKYQKNGCNVFHRLLRANCKNR